MTLMVGFALAAMVGFGLGFGVSAALRFSADDFPAIDPKGEEGVIRVWDAIESWRDLDWMFEQEPYDVDNPSRRCCELANKRLEARHRITEMLRALGVRDAAPPTKEDARERL